MENVFSETFPSGTVKVAETSITLVNNTAKTQDVSVPTDTIWHVQNIKVVNADDVARAVTIAIYKTSSKNILIGQCYFVSVSAGGLLNVPNNQANTAFMNAWANGLTLPAGTTISITWAAGGASTGAVDPDGLVILYRQLSKT